MREARLADAAINAASSDHRATVESLLDGISARSAALHGRGKAFLHTSGSSVIGAAIARRHGPGPVQARTVEEAAAVWGERAARYSFGSNSRVRGLRSRRELGWVPAHASVTDWIEREMLVG